MPICDRVVFLFLCSLFLFLGNLDAQPTKPITKHNVMCTTEDTIVLHGSPEIVSSYPMWVQMDGPATQFWPKNTPTMMAELPEVGYYEFTWAGAKATELFAVFRHEPAAVDGGVSTRLAGFCFCGKPIGEAVLCQYEEPVHHHEIPSPAEPVVAGHPQGEAVPVTTREEKDQRLPSTLASEKISAESPKQKSETEEIEIVVENGKHETTPTIPTVDIQPSKKDGATTSNAGAPSPAEEETLNLDIHHGQIDEQPRVEERTKKGEEKRKTLLRKLTEIIQDVWGFLTLKAVPFQTKAAWVGGTALAVGLSYLLYRRLTESGCRECRMRDRELVGKNETIIEQRRRISTLEAQAQTLPQEGGGGNAGASRGGKPKRGGGGGGSRQDKRSQTSPAPASQPLTTAATTPSTRNSQIASPSASSVSPSSTLPLTALLSPSGSSSSGSSVAAADLWTPERIHLLVEENQRLRQSSAHMAELESDLHLMSRDKATLKCQNDDLQARVRQMELLFQKCQKENPELKTQLENFRFPARQLSLNVSSGDWGAGNTSSAASSSTSQYVESSNLPAVLVNPESESNPPISILATTVPEIQVQTPTAMLSPLTPLAPPNPTNDQQQQSAAPQDATMEGVDVSVIQGAGSGEEAMNFSQD